jgi:hypothetical protein
LEGSVGATIIASAAPDELTAAWLDAALRSSGWLTRATVISLDVAPLGDDGATGRMFRLRPEYSAADAAPRTIIAKLAAEPGPTLDIARRFRLYEREARFYAAIAPLPHLPTPKLYYEGRDARGDHLLLLEDVGDAHPGDVIAGCGVDVIAPLVEPVARMHAQFWGGQGLEACAWLPRPNAPVTVAYSLENYERSWHAFRIRRSPLSAAVVEAGERLCGDRSVLDRMSREPNTLTHGDLRRNNMMFDDDGELATVLDWQSVTLARGPGDLAALFVGNLPPNDCARAEEELLPHYHAMLVKHGINSYSIDQCREDYGLAVAAMFAQVVMLSSFMDLGNQNATLDAIIGRPLAAVERLQVPQLLPPKPPRARVLSRVRPALRGVRDKLRGR